MVATRVTRAPNDYEQIAPVLQRLQAPPKTTGAVQCLPGDTGLYREKNIHAYEAASLEPLIAVARV